MWSLKLSSTLQSLIIFLLVQINYADIEVESVLSLQADINAPISSGGDLSPDTSYDVYRRVWGISEQEISTMRSQSMDFFKNITDIDILSLPSCSPAGDLLTNMPTFKVPTLFGDLLGTFSTPLCTTRSLDGVIYIYDPTQQRNVASFFHVRNPDIVGYKVVQSLNPPHDAREDPLPMFDTAFTLNILENGYFPCSKFSQGCVKGDRLLYGWYTIFNLYKNREWGIINYQSRGPQNILGHLTPLAFDLNSSQWGQGLANGYVSRTYQSNDDVQPCFENTCPYRFPKLLDTIEVSFRNILTFTK
ncbi:hypothetical protein cand_007970 [Cryptosporidium andersoni]|uniref:Uncharacterized protein n=1 Tax=Cryptosporidium andersoni TaxID=117008 RepID=A0A1J4MRI0_9CRYT|nr:hypothetical protein cand_007970 [Cryptosporidium andersoni]